jgi:hypothetical protein
MGLTAKGSSDGDVVVYGTPPQFPGESQGGTTMTPAIKASECLRLGPDLTPRALLTRNSPPETDLGR